MDPKLVSHYAQKFAGCDTEELGDLVARRADLSDEAAAGLDQALTRLGLRETDVYTAPLHRPPATEEEVTEQIAEDTQRSRELWRGGIATASKVMMGLTFMTPVAALLERTRIGGLWFGLLLLAAGYAGFWVGREITKTICANGEAKMEAKRKSLWVLLAVLVVAYLVVYAVSSRILGGR